MTDAPISPAVTTVGDDAARLLFEEAIGFHPPMPGACPMTWWLAHMEGFTVGDSVEAELFNRVLEMTSEHAERECPVCG